MPARKRRQPGGTPPDPKSAAEVFAERQAAAKEAQRRADRERHEAAVAARRRQELTEAKDRAAARLREARRAGAPGPVRAEAEAAYGEALAALLADERGDA